MHCLPISEMSNVGADIAKKISNLMVLITDELLRKRGWIMDKNLDNDEKFYRLPKRLFTEEQFQNMTGAAKLLYMILLERMRKKYYEDAKENAAFERCADVIT